MFSPREVGDSYAVAVTTARSPEIVKNKSEKNKKIVDPFI